MTKTLVTFILLSLLCIQRADAQESTDSLLLQKEYNSLEEALRQPDRVVRLNLSNQNIQFSDSIWSKFPNLQFLSLKNDHLKNLPEGIGILKKLKVLDLSGNDFKLLPTSFEGLSNLEELYLNDEKHFQLDKNIPILSKLPNLKSLHIENNGFKKLPKDVFMLKHIESLYLNNNKLKQVPLEIQGLKNLKYLDLYDNKLKLSNRIELEELGQGFGLKIRF